MGAYNFVRASNQSTNGGAGGLTSVGTTVTQAVLCTAATIPGAGAYHTAHAQQTSSDNRHTALILNGDSSGTLCYRSNPTAAAVVYVNPNTNMIPTVDTWTLLAITKAAGTVAPTFYMWTADTGWTIDTGSTTVANRAAGFGQPWIGSTNNAADYWNGMIAVAAEWGRVLTEGEIRSLAHGQMAWRSVGVGGLIQNGLTSSLVNLTRRGTVRDEHNKAGTATVTGTSFVPTSPPGW